MVELPRVADDSLMAYGDKCVQAPRLDGLRLLYVEDERDVAAAMRDGLAQLGALVEIATSYEMAVDKLRQIEIDALISDLNLGAGPSGRDVVLQMRAMAQHAKVPAIEVSAFGGRDDVALAREVGFADHLVKPVDIAMIATALRRVVDT